MKKRAPWCILALLLAALPAAAAERSADPGAISICGWVVTVTALYPLDEAGAEVLEGGATSRVVEFPASVWMTLYEAKREAKVLMRDGAFGPGIANSDVCGYQYPPQRIRLVMIKYGCAKPPGICAPWSP